MNKLVTLLAVLAVAALILSISKGALGLPKEPSVSALQSVETP